MHACTHEYTHIQEWCCQWSLRTYVSTWTYILINVVWDGAHWFWNVIKTNNYDWLTYLIIHVEVHTYTQIHTHVQDGSSQWRLRTWVHRIHTYLFIHSHTYMQACIYTHIHTHICRFDPLSNVSDTASTHIYILIHARMHAGIHR